MKKLSFLLILVLMVQVGCGYTTKSSLGGGLEGIYIPPFKNNVVYSTEAERNVYYPLLEVRARDKVISRFQFDGNLDIAKEENADLILKGTLLDYERVPLRYTDSDNVEEYRIRIIVSLELFDVKNQMVMWTEPAFVGDYTYFVSGPLASSEDAAVEGATEDLAKRIVERTVQNW